MMKLKHCVNICFLGVIAISSVCLADNNSDLDSAKLNAIDKHNISVAIQEINKGREIFRDETFGSESFWGGTLKLHDAISGEVNGGVGAGISPAVALALGLKVDVDKLPIQLRHKIEQGQVDLNDPKTTLALLKLGAVIGITGMFDDSGKLDSMGIQCALCHTQVDDSFAPGIGKRLDGWANRDINVGAIIAAAPNLHPFASLLEVSEDTVRTVLNSWGPGKFDAGLLIDGKAFRPDGKSAATLIPPAFGLAGVNLSTWTGWGGVAHWNAFVAVIEMGGKGNFYDPRLRDATRFPIAAANGFDDIRVPLEEDRVTSKLSALHLYQLSLVSPTPDKDSFDSVAADQGKLLFNGKAGCSRCHVPPLYTEPGWNLHKASEIGIDDFQAQRAPDGGYRTSPLKGLWTHVKGGFYHDGRFATLDDVAEHYNSTFSLGLSESEKYSLVEFMKSL